jgi:hypothetical protein
LQVPYPEEKAVCNMIGYWRPHSEYQEFVRLGFECAGSQTREALVGYRDILSKLWILDLDQVAGIIAPCFSDTGRPSKHQPEIFRTFILMCHLGVPISQFAETLEHSFVLRTACGFAKREIPSVASFYDFIARLSRIDDRPKIKKPYAKPKKKLAKGEKLPPKHPDIVARLVEKAIAGTRFDNRPELVFQQIFASVVQRSHSLGLLSGPLAASGDGTCILTGASPYGKKLCGCRDEGIYKCDCARRFSDPNATWGWDSHNEHFFYGYTGYFISTYNKDLRLDLPLYLRIVDAKRHDSVSAVVALAEFRDMCPWLPVGTFISDSASDNQATYKLLRHWGIDAVIALGKTNDGNRKYPGPLSYDEKGTPICPAGHKMVPAGYCANDRNRLKWRCPRVLGKTPEGAPCERCSPSAYGRTVYTKPEWDPRIFTAIPRGGEKWKSLMRERTAAERVNNRILNHYGVERSKTRGKARIAFSVMIAAANIHLDAQLAKLQADGAFDFAAVFLGGRAA